MKKSKFVKLLCIVLSLALIIVSVPMMVNATQSTVRFGVISDIHYFGNALKGNNCEAYQEFMSYTSRSFNEEDALLDNALDAILARAREDSENYLLIPGDLTKDGEYVSHQELAARLEAFEEETGIQVLVVPGNHDINNSNAISFETGEKTAARMTAPEDFRELYANLGYDLADSFFTPAEGKKGGMLSYAASLGNYRVIAIDSCIYSNDNGATDNEHLTDGVINDDLLAWIEAECARAQENGQILVGIQHHNTVPHIDIEESTFWAFVNADWRKTADALADAGLHYMFTGHLHASDIASYTSDNGNTITDILTATITGYPNTFRIVDFTATSNDDVTAEVSNYDVDVDRPVTVGDRVFEAPYKFTYSMGQTFGHGGFRSFIDKLINSLIAGDLLGAIIEDGLYNYLESELNLSQIIIDALGTNGLAIGNVEILTVSQNAMGLVKDLCDQIDKLYLENPDDLRALASWLADTLLSYEPSSYPATAFSEYGFGSGDAPGTLDDLAQEAILYYYGGDEDISDNRFFLDVLDSFENRDGAKKLFNFLRTTLINELIEDRLLGKIDLNVDALFPEGTLLVVLGKVLDAVVDLIFRNDTDILNIANGVLSLLGYGSIDGILDALVIDEYLTDSQFEAWGHTISWMIGSLVIDTNCGDSNEAFSFNGPVEVEATVDNYRLPSNVNITLGEENGTSYNITWYTKHGVDGTNIQIQEKAAGNSFTGSGTLTAAGITADAYEEVVTRGYPGADLGILGLLPCKISYVYHTVELSGLTPGKEYVYRIGDSDFGWWSEPQTINAADGDGTFSFIHLSDMQAQNEKQYRPFAGVLDAAFATCPNAEFIVSSGDQVDLGTNFKLWKFMLNSSDWLLSKPFMPTTGNHEDEGSILTSHFNLPNVAPNQNLDTGVYYSYDYENAHFIVLNTNDVDADELSAEQLEWLKADAKASDAKWKFVVLHKAPYSNGSHYDDDDVIGIRKQLCALMPYLGIDIVFQGHDHVYLRTNTMNANLIVPSQEREAEYDGLTYSMKVNPKGTIYSIPGTAGVKVYAVKDNAATDKLFPRAQAIVNADSPMFTTIKIDGDCLYYDSYKVENGAAVRADSFAIEKTTASAPSDSAASGVLERLIGALDFTIIWRVIITVCPLISKLFDIML